MREVRGDHRPNIFNPWTSHPATCYLLCFLCQFCQAQFSFRFGANLKRKIVHAHQHIFCNVICNKVSNIQCGPRVQQIQSSSGYSVAVPVSGCNTSEWWQGVGGTQADSVHSESSPEENPGQRFPAPSSTLPQGDKIIKHRSPVKICILWRNLSADGRSEWVHQLG